MQNKLIHFLILFLLLSLNTAYGQVNSREKLEKRRLELQKEITQINKQLLGVKRSESTALFEYNQLKRKINIRRRLIKTLQREINATSHSIRKTNQEIAKLEKDLEALKQDYANMVRHSYNSRSRENKLYFLFSSENFQQAYKRMQYMKQYSKYRQQQAVKIEEKKDKLTLLKVKLEKDKADKKKLFATYKKEANVIAGEQANQALVVANIKKKKSHYLAQIKAKQKEQARINRLIDKLIEKAIVKSNKKVRKSHRKKGQFFLTPEGKKLAGKFSSNKGLLPWPVKKAYISRKFGVQHHEIFKNVKLQTNGIYLATEPNSKARAVFEGTVLQIQLIPGGNNSVFVKHGNYLTIYGNLKEVYVKPGDKVKTKQELGLIATDRHTGKTELKFRIYKNMSKLNPELWLQKR